MYLLTRIASISVACAQLACAEPEFPSSSADSQAAHVREVVAAGGVVDSIHPIEVHLDRFRATVSDTPSTLRNASPSVNSLVARWAQAVVSLDTAALNAAVLDRAEFAWLYYPNSLLSKPPYEAPPELLWGQILASSNEGAQKLLQKFGGRQLSVENVTCPATVTEGDNTLYDKCVVRFRVDGRTDSTQQLFGTIIERHGRYKFISLSNRL